MLREVKIEVLCNTGQWWKDAEGTSKNIEEGGEEKILEINVRVHTQLLES